MTTTRTLLPDRSLDAIAAERILGWRWYAFGRERPGGPWRGLSENPQDDEILLPGFYVADGTEPLCHDPYRDVPRFCISLDAALTLVEALRAKGYGFEIVSGITRGPYWAVFCRDHEEWNESKTEWADPVAARAVTVAAILAAGGDPWQEEQA